MSGNNFIFTSGNDPLLGAPASYETRYKELERMGQMIEQRKQTLQQMKAQMGQPQPQQGGSPVWDEIDGIVDSLSRKEKEFVFSNEEFMESNNAVMGILQEKYLQMMRPVVEGCQEGKDALERHLTLIRRLRKTAAAEAEREIDEYNEYREKYADIPYTEYLKMKRDKTVKK